MNTVFLIKNSRILINNNVTYPFLKQYGVAEVLKDNGIAVDYDESVLYKKGTPSNSIVFRTIRNGLRKIAERDDFKKPEVKQTCSRLYKLNGNRCEKYKVINAKINLEKE